MARRVRSFCLARPASPGGFLLLSETVAVMARSFMEVLSLRESVLALIAIASYRRES
jgi:hypothetical protein